MRLDTSCLVAIAFGEAGAARLSKRLDSFDELFAANLLEAELRASFAREGVPLDNVLVFPNLIPSAHERDFVAEIIPSGLAALDEMLGGGFERGTITILSGPSGVGKTTLGMQFMKEAATRGERSVVYTFEEQLDTLFHRCTSIGMPLREMVQRGSLSVLQVEPLRFSPAEFALLVRREVEERQARIIMIDGISGYRLTLAGDDLVAQLHALGRYMKNMGVTVLFTNDTEGIIGEFRATDVGVSYLCDNLVFLRYVEIDGKLRTAVGVLKKRVGDFGRELREIRITTGGIRLGEPLSGLRGVLTGNPEWVDRHGRSAPE